jgi:phosphoribosylaminoimidazole-succinocarboxamide synthase
MGKEGQEVPLMTDNWLATISARYIELYERMIGEKFQPEPLDAAEVTERVEQSLKKLV